MLKIMKKMAVKTIQEIYVQVRTYSNSVHGADLAKRVSFRTDYKYVICGKYVVLYKIEKSMWRFTGW